MIFIFCNVSISKQKCNKKTHILLIFHLVRSYGTLYAFHNELPRIASSKIQYLKNSRRNYSFIRRILAFDRESILKKVAISHFSALGSTMDYTVFPTK